MLDLVKGYCGLCNDGREKRLIAGVCQFHYWGSLRGAGAPSIVRTRGIVRHIQEETEEDREMDRWYADRVAGMTGWCWNCDESIVTANYKFAKASIAHVLPVEHFASIRIHQQNCLELGGACGCHTKYDSNWKAAEQMRIFPLAVSKFLLLYPFIALAERRRIPEVLMNALPRQYQ